jgi:hypothetical protein
MDAFPGTTKAGSCALRVAPNGRIGPETHPSSHQVLVEQLAAKPGKPRQAVVPELSEDRVVVVERQRCFEDLQLDRVVP